VQRTPLSKQRNKHVQTTLIEAAKRQPGSSRVFAFQPTIAKFLVVEELRWATEPFLFPML
jgi:hypothetical protein